MEEEPKIVQVCEKTSKVEKDPRDVGEKCDYGPIVSTACRNGGSYPKYVDEIENDGQGKVRIIEPRPQCEEK